MWRRTIKNADYQMDRLDISNISQTSDFVAIIVVCQCRLEDRYPQESIVAENAGTLSSSTFRRATVLKFHGRKIIETVDQVEVVEGREDENRFALRNCTGRDDDKLFGSDGTSEFQRSRRSLKCRSEQKLERTSENAQVAMALLARTFRTVAGLPWSTLEFLGRAMQCSAMPVIVERPTSEIWAEDLFTPCSTKCWMYDNDDLTDCSGSEIGDDDDDEEWSCSESEEELDGFRFVNDGDVDFWGDHWFWHDDTFIVQSSSDLTDLSDVETTNYVMKKLVDYVMPSMNFNAETVDNWIDKYGSSRSQFRFVTFSPREPNIIDSSSAFVLSSTSTGLFVAVL